jgi:mannose-1-phosphate guanylyltransferase
MFYAVIPAGGSGTRLWPLSRSDEPKFLHPLTGTPATLLQATMARLEPLVDGPAAVYVVTGVAHAAAVARQVPSLPADNVLVEPAPRDSCAAIGLAAALIAERDPDAIMGAFPADHLVRGAAEFAAVVRSAIAGAERGYLMTIGIAPTRPETGYGYLQCGEPVDGGPIRHVREFKEKPSYDLAQAYVATGDYLWNAGMFVWRVGTFLAELKRQQETLYDGLRRIAAAWFTDVRDEVLGEVWPTLTKISVDYAVMEGAAAAGLVATVPGEFGWNDVGDFDTLGEVLAADGDGNVVLGGAADDKAEALLKDCTRSVVVPYADRLVAVLGMDGVIVVDTPDAVLVCARDRAQDVKGLVDSLKARGDTRYV